MNGRLPYFSGSPIRRAAFDSTFNSTNMLPLKSSIAGSASGTTSESPEVRDRYGFRRQLQYVSTQIYEEWSAKYNIYLQIRRRKWEAYIRECGIEVGQDGVPITFPPRSKKTKRYIRKGVPVEWRGAMWFFYARGHEYVNENNGLYEKLWRQGLEQPPPDSEIIERDLHRTFPDNIHFRNQTQSAAKPASPSDSVSSLSEPAQSESAKSNFSRRSSGVHETPIVQALRRVLLAFSLYVPKTGYCQSLNFIAGLLLLFLDEEKAFWMLVLITQKYLPGVHEINLEGANIDQGVLMMCIQESLPKIWKRIGAGLDGSQRDDMVVRLPPITLCTAAWFMSGFIGVLPIESVVRVWDSFFYEGSKVFFRIALTILKIGEPQIEGVRDLMEIFQVVQTIPKQLIDANALMESCFRRHNGFGHVSQEEIDLRRRYVANRRKTLNSAGANEHEYGLEAAREAAAAAAAESGKVSTQDIDTPRAPNKRASYKRFSATSGKLYSPTTNFDRGKQLLRMGSSNMLSLTADDDYFASSRSLDDEESTN
ncbi:rab-GTPase-TBC domain-containing protein [Lipomyces oligophaga]|uniref:rab-GTPase-TBC domain-containing protein n=1 Tax=Lipomyces oligophaga TaxID=45792 RepID=UPI0034CEFDD7